MVLGKIIYDKAIRKPDEWEQELSTLVMNFKRIKDALGIETPFFEEFGGLNSIQSHYFAILNNNPQNIISWIRGQAKEKIGISPIIWDAVLDSRKTGGFYRIDIPKDIEVYRKPIYCVQSRWIPDKELRTLSPTRIRNFMDKLEAGEF